jgi:hypothetical protein
VVAKREQEYSAAATNNFGCQAERDSTIEHDTMNLLLFVMSTLY